MPRQNMSGHFCTNENHTVGANSISAHKQTTYAFVGSIWNAPLRNRVKQSIYGGNKMQTRVALIGIVVEDTASVAKLNDLLHTYGEYIIGRMGVPHKERGISIISVAMDAPQDVISALSGKLGALPGVSSKTIYSKVGDASE